jgi:sugar phosphate isomerase/epimerase
VKDLRRTAGGERQMVDVGAGGIDFRGLYAARAQAGVRHLVVEHDNPPDPAASIRASYAGLRRAVG